MIGRLLVELDWPPHIHVPASAELIQHLQKEEDFHLILIKPVIFILLGQMKINRGDFRRDMVVMCMVYRALIGLLSRMDPHVDEKLVSGIEGLVVAWTAHPVACEILSPALFHVRLFYVPHQLILLLIDGAAVHPPAAVSPKVVQLYFLFLQHRDLG